MSNLIVRAESKRDVDAISALITQAFKDDQYSQGTEAAIVNELRDDGDLIISLVAELDGVVVGHVAFSPVTVDNEVVRYFGLGPVAVLPEHQQQGIGKALITEGLTQLKALGAHGCVVLGEPSYYQKFGFAVDEHVTLADVPPEYFTVNHFMEQTPKGEVRYASGFSAT
ncbi:GNAT family N-acetyltransferase [Thalassotalea euphylliae]|uniref:GNAT family N-acetyltransferase n=1 Tax=Thalassotalea euphylliae TaxID=1655234 RepID=UPI003645C224